MSTVRRFGELTCLTPLKTEHLHAMSVYMHLCAPVLRSNQLFLLKMCIASDKV